MDQYYLGAQASSAVTPPGNLTVPRMLAARADGGSTLQTYFQIMLPQPAPVVKTQPLDYIWAFGLLGATGALQQHTQNNADQL